MIRTDGRTFLLSTADTSYAFALDPAGLLRHLHLGPRVDALEDFEAPAKWDLSTNDPVMDVTAEEYPVHGQFRSKEQCLAVRFADGSREVRVEVTGHEIRGDELVVTMADPIRHLAIALHYRVLTDLDLIERWAVIRNDGPDPWVVESVASAQFHVPYSDLTLRNTSGLWAAEYQAFAQPVGPAPLVLQARRGISSHHHNPYLIVDRAATETRGEVWFAALRHTGNFRASAEASRYGGTTFQVGVGDYDFEVALPPGEELATPAVVAGYTDRGLGAMSHRLHRFGRSLLTADLRPVLYNSWEATGFDVTAGNQLELARQAAALGVELFVIDDGWFGRRGAPGDGLGDWWVNREKFPDGLAPVIQAVRDLGMRFGIWVEPEMVSPNSDLYAAHPDWIHRDPLREPDQLREQYVLNLARADVREWIVTTLDALLREHRIDYFKWDANRPMTAVGARDVWLRHVEGLYAVVAELKRRHPGLAIESCASGGGRVDFGALGVFDDVWASDDTDARDRLDIQRGLSYVYPAKAVRTWVTDSVNFLTQRPIPLTFRFHVAMTGSLGIGADVTTWTRQERDQAAALVAQYQAIRATVQHGDLHRLDNPSSNDYWLLQYAAPEQSVVFAFLPASRVGRQETRVRLRGLDPGARYRFHHDWRWQTKTGAYLMAHGIPLWLQGDYASTLITFDRQPG